MLSSKLFMILSFLIILFLETMHVSFPIEYVSLINNEPS